MVSFDEEKQLWRQGYVRVVGLDEAGRGPLAGPVVAAAVCVSKFKHLKFIQNSKLEIQNLRIDDSKKLSPRQREDFYDVLTSHPSVVWSVGVVSERIIDKIDILQATKLAMQKALYALCQKKVDARRLPFQKNRRPTSADSLVPDFLLIDGNFTIDSNLSQISIIKGDSKVFSIAAASIIAKVTRDRLMQKMHTKYPEYGFNQHKGYGTALHLSNLKEFGPSKIHRKTFWPVRTFYQ